MIPGDNDGRGSVDSPELQAPKTLHGGCECLQALKQEVALEGEMPHLVAQEFFCDDLHDGITATQREQSKIDFGDELGGEQDLDVELEVHEITHPAEDGVGPLFLEQSAAQMEHRACEQCGVALLLSDEEVHGALVATQVLQSGDAACVAT